VESKKARRLPTGSPKLRRNTQRIPTEVLVSSRVFEQRSKTVRVSSEANSQLRWTDFSFSGAQRTRSCLELLKRSIPEFWKAKNATVFFISSSRDLKTAGKHNRKILPDSSANQRASDYNQQEKRLAEHQKKIQNDKGIQKRLHQRITPEGNSSIVRN
jgi:hypothetical protein